MLSLLKFKKSMFTGVLDGGKNEVFLGGTRLKKFMDSVEGATGSMGDSSTPPDGNGVEQVSRPSADAADSTSSQSKSRGPAQSNQATSSEKQASPSLQPQALGDLLTAGAAFLDQLGKTLSQADSSKPDAASSAMSRIISRDESTGQTYLKLPLPQGDAMQSLVGLLKTVATSLQKPQP